MSLTMDGTTTRIPGSATCPSSGVFSQHDRQCTEKELIVLVTRTRRADERDQVGPARGRGEDPDRPGVLFSQPARKPYRTRFRSTTEYDDATHAVRCLLRLHEQHVRGPYDTAISSVWFIVSRNDKQNAADPRGEKAMRDLRRRLLTAAAWTAGGESRWRKCRRAHITPLTTTRAGFSVTVVKPAPQRTVLPDPLTRIRRCRRRPHLAAITAPAPTVQAPAAVVYQGPVAAPVCEGQTTAADDRWFWERWRSQRDVHHSTMQAKMWGYPEEFEAPPLGHFVKSHFRTMVANGEIAQMVLYRYDFVDGHEFLNLRGRDQLVKIANAVATIHAPSSSSGHRSGRNWPSCARQRC